MWWFGRETPAAVLVVVAVVLFFVGLIAPGPAHRFDRALERVGDIAARGLGVALSALMWVVIVLPIWALSRLVKYSPLDDGWTTTRSNWIGVGRSRTPGGRPVGPARMGGRDPSRSQAVRRRAALRYLVAVPAVVVVGLVAFPWISERYGLGDTRQDAADLRQNEPGTKADIADVDVTWVGLPVDDYAHEDEPWAKDFFRELVGAGTHHDLILGQRLRDFRGEHLNIVDSRRQGYEPRDPELTVWFFGGSTMFGIGQRDDHTIPSVVARLAEADGIRIEPVNFGVSGDVNWIETIRFAQALEDLPLPDLVVFYDGTNEEGVGYQRMEDGLIDPDVIERPYLSDEEQNLHSGSYGGETIDQGPERVQLHIDLTARQYRRGVDVGRRLAGSYGTEVMYFWQPVAVAKDPSPADAELYRRLGFDQDMVPETTRNYEAILETSGAGSIDLTAALDDTDQPVFFDFNHTNERGAAIVAAEMYEYLEPQLATLSAGGA